jgi:multiple sugar transport system ATP-binding protein
VQTRSEIKRLLHRFGITSLYVTHDQVEALALADQIVVMHAGRIEQVGTYPSLTENPVNMFVAGFLGLPPMILFTGGSISGSRLVLDGYSIPLPKLISSLVQEEQPVTLGIRQEAIAVTTGPASTDSIHMRAEVEGVESDFVHRMQTVHLRTGRFKYSGLCPLETMLRIGQSVHVALDPARLHFFDTKSGQRL